RSSRCQRRSVAGWTRNDRRCACGNTWLSARQQGTIGRPQARPADLAPQHLQLMPQQEDLDLLRPLRTTKENEKLEQTADHPASEGQPFNQQTPSAPSEEFGSSVV